MTIRRHAAIEIVSSQRVYEGRIFDLVRDDIVLPSGLRQSLTIVDHPGAVGVAALDAGGNLLLVRQYRHACGDWLIEIPAGRVEPGEDRLAAAMRELEEETKHRARSWKLLREFFAAPGFCSELLSIFLASDLVPVSKDALRADADEEIDLVRRSPREILAEGGVGDAKTLIAAAALLF